MTQLLFIAAAGHRTEFDAACECRDNSRRSCTLIVSSDLMGMQIEPPEEQ